MTTRTHTPIGLTRWQQITMWSISAFVGGALLNTIIRFTDTDWLVIIGALANLVAVAGLILGIIGAAKVFGGLKTGVALLVGGAVLFVVGWMMLNTVEMVPFLLGEVPDLEAPMYIIGFPTRSYGAIFFIIGAIMAVVSYLRRVLKAVESKS